MSPRAEARTPTATKVCGGRGYADPVTANSDADTVPVRLFRPEDAEPLTRLLHEAYAELGAMGLNFTAVDQDVATTLRRAEAGSCWVAERAGHLMGTIAMSCPPYEPLRQAWPPARLPGIAWLNQLAVGLQARGTGVASLLFHTGMEWAREQGATTVGLDTAAPASHLIALYERWGFATSATIHWPGKNYDSVVMTRPLQG